MTLSILLVDECLVDNGGCEQRCEDTALFYTCGCGDGYTLTTNGLTCDGNNNNELIITGATPQIITPSLTQYQHEDDGHSIIKRNPFSILSCSLGIMATLTSCYTQCLQLADTVGTFLVWLHIVMC